MIRDELYTEHKFVALAFLAIGGLPAAIALVVRGQFAIAAGAALIGAAALWFVIGYMRWLQRLRAARRARVLPLAAVAAIARQVGPPPAVILATLWGCYLIASAIGVLAGLLLLDSDWHNPLEAALAIVFATVLLLVGAGFVVSGHRVVRQGDPNSLYGLTVAMCLVTSGAVVYGLQHFNPHRWGDIVGYAVGTLALATLGFLPTAGPGARWLSNHHAAAAAYRIAHRHPLAASSNSEPSRSADALDPRPAGHDLPTTRHES